jgi:hypothetical protein
VAEFLLFLKNSSVVPDHFFGITAYDFGNGFLENYCFEQKPKLVEKPSFYEFSKNCLLWSIQSLFWLFSFLKGDMKVI